MRVGIVFKLLVELGERAGEIIIQIIKVFDDAVAPVGAGLSSNGPVEDGGASTAHFGSAAILLRYLRTPHENKINVARVYTISFKNKNKNRKRKGRNEGFVV